MSPTTDNFIHSLVEMSKAFEELPQVQTELKSANAKIEASERHAQALEENIIRYKAQIEELQQAKRSVEAERDDAELRFLELDEKSGRAIHLLAQIRDTAVQADHELNPPKSVPEPEPIPTPPAEQEAKHSTYETGYVADAAQPQEHTSSGWNPNVEPIPSEVPKSDANPTAVDSHHNHSPSVQTEASGSSGNAAPTDTAQPQPSGPYTGKRYFDHPTYLPRDQWLAGGGSEADYDWRPGRS